MFPDRIGASHRILIFRIFLDRDPKSPLSCARATPQRGVSRSSRNVGWDAVDAHRRAQFIGATSGVCADGEVVWFWRPDAGAKFVG
jgi:hypothetical protein